jgi:4-carboxymuconolactone decarboxylase
MRKLAIFPSFFFKGKRTQKIKILCMTVVFISGCLTNSIGGTMQSQNQSKRYQIGWGILKKLDESAAVKVTESLNKISPELSQFIIEFAYGEVYSRPDLDLKSRQIATVAALAAMGTAPEQLKFHIGAALNIGCTPNEIIEVMYLISVFCGFPASINGIKIAETIFNERKIEIERKNQNQKNADSRRDRGLRALSEVSGASGQDVINSLSRSAPELADFIIDFSYGDVISRPVLDPKHKEIAIIAACVAMGTAKPQLKVHINAALRVGCTQKQIKETIIQMALYSGFPSSLNAIAVANEVFN